MQTRVHNIYREGEYPTLYYPVKRHCVKSYAISGIRHHRYKGLLIGVEYGVDTLKGKSVLISMPFNTYQQVFIAAKPSARYCITFNTVSFDRLIQCWILSLTTVYIL